MNDGTFSNFKAMDLIKKITLVLSLILFGYASAQRADPKAKQILDVVSANYKAKKTNTFKFSFTAGGKLQKGSFYSEGNKYRLDLMGNEQIFDGNKIYSINRDDSEITIAKPNSADVTFSPISYLEAYKKGYNIQYVGRKVVNGVSADYIKMSPVKNNGVKVVNLFINPAKKQLIKLEQVGMDNSMSTITITSYVANQSLSPSLFKFNKALYKNYLVTDL